MEEMYHYHSSFIRKLYFQILEVTKRTTKTAKANTHAQDAINETGCREIVNIARTLDNSAMYIRTFATNPDNYKWNTFLDPKW